MAIDKVTLQIFANHCRAATESMAYTLYRTAHSTFVKETQDFTTGLATPEGKTFAAPMDLGATWFVGLDYGKVIDLISDYEEGDVCLTNDPYSGFVCTHAVDIHLWKPIFYGGDLVCFSVGHIHNTDIGGAVPASCSRTLTEIYQEGIRIPPLKLFKRGELNEELLKILLTNVRQPEQNWGDLKALIAALNTGERKVHEIISKFGIDEFNEGIHSLLDYTEIQTRAIINSIPDGDYFFSDYIDEDSVSGPPCRLAITMKVRGDRIDLDFTGSDPQLTSSLNIPTGGFKRHTLLLVAIFHAFYTLDPNLLLNTGITQPFDCVLPEGTVVNPQFPAAVGMRSMTAGRLQDVILGCLSQAIPEKMPSASSGTGSMVNVSTINQRTGKHIMASIEPMIGGAGGLPFADGPNGSGGNLSFLANTPIEINEAEVPIKILRYELVPDSGGAGKFRGGLGCSLSFQVFSPNTVITARNRDRSLFRAWGVLGGKAGSLTKFLLNPGTSNERNLGNTDIISLEPEDIIEIISSGGGGWGNPLERDVNSVLADVLPGFVSKTAAKSEYGVVINDDQVDPEASKMLRTKLRSLENISHFDFGREREKYERTWTKELYEALTIVLASIPVNWRFLVKHKIWHTIEDLSSRRNVDVSDIYKAFEDLKKRFPLSTAILQEVKKT
jgi:N-methylhydantoinase B